MSIFERFRKVPKPAGIAEPSDVTAKLAAAIGDSRIIDGRIRLPHSGAMLKVELAERESTGTATLDVWVDHPTWDRTFFDAASGHGTTQEEATDRAILNVGLHTVHLLDHLTEEDPDDRFSTNWMNVQHDWSVWLGYISSMTTGQTDVSGAGEPYWHLLKDGIMARLGNQKVTYVKVTAAWFGTEITAEVRINNVVSTELDQILRTHIETTWPAQAGVFHKQLFWIVQDARTHQPYLHTASEIKQDIVIAGQLFDEAWNQPEGFSQQRYEMSLGARVADPSLVAEIATLVPEMAAHLAYPNLPVSETITIAAGNSEHVVNVHQLASFAYLVDALDQTWCREVSEQTIKEWIAYSALGDAMAKLQQAGQQPESLATPIRLSHSMGAGYTLR